MTGPEFDHDRCISPPAMGTIPPREEPPPPPTRPKAWTRCRPYQSHLDDDSIAPAIGDDEDDAAVFSPSLRMAHSVSLVQSPAEPSSPVLKPQDPSLLLSPPYMRPVSALSLASILSPQDKETKRLADRKRSRSADDLLVIADDAGGPPPLRLTSPFLEEAKLEASSVATKLDGIPATGAASDFMVLMPLRGIHSNSDI